MLAAEVEGNERQREWGRDLDGHLEKRERSTAEDHTGWVSEQHERDIASYYFEPPGVWRALIFSR